MKILISGASGLIGTALQNHLKGLGHQVFTLVRDPKKLDCNSIYWNPKEENVELQNLEGFDAVVNLAGTNIAGALWTEERKQSILDSRLDATNTLSLAFERLENPPKVFISASAIGFYGDRGDEICTEETPLGKGFLAEVCRQWELTAKPYSLAHVRTVNLRFGIVLSSKGGALANMLPPFRLGLGGPLGSGKQYMSWIDIDDLVSIITFAIHHNQLIGPVNAVSPNPVTNKEFTKTIGKVLHRPTFFRVPAFMMRWLLGKEMADEVLLSSTRVYPTVLEKNGYQFRYPDLKSSLEHQL